jgi:hypothetical protein
MDLNNSDSDINVSITPNNLNHFDYDRLTGKYSIPVISQKTSKTKPRKRLSSK